jgi:FkbM family methyltransferase
MHEFLPRGRRVWSQIPTGPARGLWLRIEPYLEEKYLTGCPEPGVQEEILHHLRPGGCFYDVGAHIGFYSLLAARLVGEEGRVVAFEPDPINVTVLHEDLSRNDLSVVDVVPAAMWSHLGNVTFQRSTAVHGEESSRRGKVVALTGEGFACNLIKVEAVTLDSFTWHNRPPTMVKVDVEGAEVEVLKGAQKLASQIRPVWLFEVHHQQAANFLAENLQQNKYNIKWLPRHPDFPFPRHLVAQPEEECQL